MMRLLIIISMCLTAINLIQAAHAQDAATDQWFRFETESKVSDAKPMLNLREMNPERAGRNGWIVNKDGYFVESKTGKQVRFFSVNGPNPWGLKPWGSPEERRNLSALLANRGVNLMRNGPVRGAHKMSDDQVQGFLDLIEAGAEYGIYTGVTFFFPLEVRVPEIAGYEKRGVQSLVYFHPQAQKAYFDLLEKLVHTPDANTGKSISQNPAVAFIEIINEDNLFFFTFAPSKMPEEPRKILETQYADWLRRRHGTLEKAVAGWGANPSLPRDNVQEGRMEMYDASWFMDADWAREQRNPARALDQLRFMTELQINFFEKAEKQLRDWGYGGCVLATNWKTASSKNLNALDKYTNAAVDMMDRHAYFGTPHQGAKYGNTIRKNGIYANDSALDDPMLLIAGIEYKGYPEILSEFQYPAPNTFRAEHVWLGAHYGAMLDIDGFSFNEIHSDKWQDELRVFNVLTPVTTQQFPAAALVYRRGLVETAKPVVSQSVSPEDLLALKGTAIWDRMNIDEMRAAEMQGTQADATLDPRMWMVGPVQIAFGDETGPVQVEDLSKYIDDEKSIIRSRTGQLVWNYDDGVVTADAPAVQSACGFLGKAGAIELSAATINLENRYGTVWLVSLDGQPIAQSNRMLLQVMTEERPVGWKEEPASFTDKKGDKYEGFKILDKGAGGFEIRSPRGTIRLKRPDAGSLRVTPLDVDFLPRGEAEPAKETIQLLPDCLHYIIEK
ncbi:MAG: hypothetical protein ACLFUS_17925 [Candidatus Sumerlaeia bacterium]